MAWTDVAPVVVRLLGARPGRLSDPRELGGSSRGVWRVDLTAGAGPAAESYVVKVLGDDERFDRERAALGALEGSGVAPRLLAADRRARVLVLEDLGDGGTLADALLGSDARSAETALGAWVDGVAALHRASTAPVRGDFADALARHGVTEPAGLGEAVDLAVGRYARVLPELGLDAEVVPAAALQRLVGSLSARRVLSPTDACPDNNVATPSGTRLVDFEGATLWNPAWDVAYLQVPWASCWCAWRLPDDVERRAVER